MFDDQGEGEGEREEHRGDCLWKGSDLVLAPPAANPELSLSSPSLAVDGMAAAAPLVDADPVIAPAGLWHPQQHSSDAPSATNPSAAADVDVDVSLSACVSFSVCASLFVCPSVCLCAEIP